MFVTFSMICISVSRNNVEIRTSGRRGSGVGLRVWWKGLNKKLKKQKQKQKKKEVVRIVLAVK